MAFIVNNKDNLKVGAMSFKKQSGNWKWHWKLASIGYVFWKRLWWLIIIGIMKNLNESNLFNSVEKFW